MAFPASPPRSTCVQAVLQNIRSLDFTRRPPSQEYPSISSIPRTSQERLDAATAKFSHDQSIIPSSSPTAAPYLATDTVLYLAYGSNLCAQTFLGQRGIRPISAVNVSVPTLRLTFDLPGIAYKEPCFANVAPRKIPEPPKLPPGLPDPPEIPQPPPGYTFPPRMAQEDEITGRVAHWDPQWNNGLIGVVYEVTPEDYATIVRTEGGGASYKDILVPCIAIPSRPPGIPEKPPVPGLPKPFWAHTLYAPRIPTNPDDGDGDDEANRGVFRKGDDGDDGNGDDDDKCPIDKLKDWWKKLLLSPIRPDPEYAQPSARYLKLIADGAAEHDLPVEYQRWLSKLQPYTITSRLQAIGQYLFLAFVMPVMLLYLAIGSLLADENGQTPVWFGLLMETYFHLSWGVYDRWFKPIFGDGERTVEDDDGEGVTRGCRLRKKTRKEARVDEEKANLLTE
ncbi:hypothetical protein N0V93_003664 [Gnomoniopsis smithogilvyi]|uniref:gamma-glutamylcyclotransferase n=1 Tax=Gnomoniopsis smithogilvyi TaxID=1191159 RepID=A0A9W8YYW8_9PEZI|nr:hypothetical protein N0V93_003664 [Gnomoniopsis smithogilvyi]